MSITLRPEQEKAVAEAIETGAYENADQVIDRALELLRSETAWLGGRKGEIAEKIERAFNQFERGEYYTAEDSRADMEKRKATRLAERKS